MQSPDHANSHYDDGDAENDHCDDDDDDDDDGENDHRDGDDDEDGGDDADDDDDDEEISVESVLCINQHQSTSVNIPVNIQSTSQSTSPSLHSFLRRSPDFMCPHD